MAEKITSEIVNAALDPSERIQYRNLLVLLSEGRVLNASQQKKYDTYVAKCEKYLASQSGGSHHSSLSNHQSDSADAESIGIPSHLRVPRRYTMSHEALAQRRAASQSPAKATGMEGNRNGWKHGHYAKQFINKLKPCKSTCPQYPCSLVEEGQVDPGDDCLDKADVITFYRAVHNAIVNKEYDQFNDLAALQIGNTIKVIDMLIEDIQRDGTVVKRERYDKEGVLNYVEYVTHPSLLSLPKLLADLGLNPAEFLITPRSIKRADGEDGEEGKGFVDAMTQAAKALGKIATRGTRKQHDPDDGEE